MVLTPARFVCAALFSLTATLSFAFTRGGGDGFAAGRVPGPVGIGSVRVNPAYAANGGPRNVAQAAEPASDRAPIQTSPTLLTVPTRDLCVTIALPGAASECGDLRMAHALPAVRTLNKVRAPVLVYNSAFAAPHFRVVYPLTLSSSADSVVQTYTLSNGRLLGRQRWNGWPAGQTRRLVFTVPLPDVATGLLTFTVQTTSWLAGVATTRTESFETPFVNRRESRFGAGWWVAGLEQITHLADGRKLWVGGDGTARIYAPVNDSTWVAPNPERLDILCRRYNAQGTARYVRLLPGGAHVVFGATGLQDSTVTRTGQVTAFAYGANGLATITAPGSAVWLFEYGSVGSWPARLWRVQLQRGGAVRYVEFGPQNGDPRIGEIIDPDSGRVSFAYVAPDTSQRLISGRMDQRRLAWTRYDYDAGAKVTLGQQDMALNSTAGALALHITPGESRGMAPYAALFDSVYTRLDGPRPDTDVVDVTRFWISPGSDLSMPERVVDALGNETLLTRGDVRFPGLVTRVDGPVSNGTRLSSTATYDARGNLQSSTVLNPLGDGNNATTVYERTNAAWPDFVTRVTLPMGEVSDVGYDAAGNRIWQQDGRGAISQVKFHYNTLGLPDTVTDQFGRFETMAYDAAGNLHATRSALGIWSLAYSDVLGRDTLTIAPMDSAATATDSTALKTAGIRTHTVYDAADRPLLTQTIGPATSYPRTYTGMPEHPGADTLTVRNVYDHGMLVRTDRWSSPDSAHVDTISTRWRYDVAGRKVAEIAPTSPDSAERKDSTVYDAAGNVIRTIDRLGLQVTMQYDALGRMTQRVLPATTSAAGETETFTYDEAGRLRSAVNSAARVRRGYLRGGALAADSLEVATEAGAWGRHLYVTRYRYHLEGRRITMTVPDSVAPSSTQKQFQYAYDPVTGSLRSVTDPLGNVTSFAQRRDGALDTLRLPGGITETYRYDDDGQMTRRLRTRDQGGVTTLYDDSTVYTARGKVAYAAQLDGNARMHYDGLGHLVHSFSHDAEAHTGQDSEEEYRYDALGNALWHRNSAFTTQSGPPAGPIYAVSQYYQRWTGRHFATMKAANETLQGGLRPREDAFRSFDAAGNLTRSVDTTGVRLLYGATAIGTGGARPRVRTLFAFPDESQILGDVTGVSDGVLGTTTEYGYRGDGRMVTVSRTAGCVYLVGQGVCASQVPDYNSQTRVETYRYDALGRRVWVKTVTPSAGQVGQCSFRCDNTTRRTIWDGDQVLAEIRYPNGQGEQDSGLDSANVAALADMAARPTTSAQHPYGGANTSDWAQHGRVLYTHAGGIDQPLGLIRMDYSHDFRAPILIVPHANWRGMYEQATIVASAVCKDVWLPMSEMVFMDSTGRRMVAPVVTGPDGNETDTLQTRCIETDFPGKASNMRHLLRQNSVAGPVTWMGSLVQDNQDASGLMYRRNRFYDPKSGRFTQEDPIGLAGGVNSYGFAEGDPVSYADPYGLCVPMPSCLSGFGSLQDEWEKFKVGAHEAWESTRAALRQSPGRTRLYARSGAGIFTTQIEVDGEGRMAARAGGTASTSGLTAQAGVSFDINRIPTNTVAVIRASRGIARVGPAGVSITTTVAATRDRQLVPATVGIEIGASLKRPGTEKLPVGVGISPRGGCIGSGCQAH